MSTYKYVILGGGLVAGYAAQEFAAHDVPAGEICIVSAEKTLPYERPPLSKDFLAGDESVEDILINEPDFYDENGIAVKLKTAITDVDLDKKELYANGDTINFERLLIATGAHPKILDVPGADLDNIFYLRSVEDAQQIRKKARNARTAIVIGGSFIGMEVTSVLQGLGVETTMVFPEERVWESFFTPQMSTFFERYYRDRGVTILHQEKVTAFEGKDRVTHVITASGQRIVADLVVAGIGVVPNIDLFADSDLKLTDEGIIVNRFLETNLPDVLAAGDVTCYKDVVFERPLHVEHWDNAVNQGRHAARVMLGEYQPYEHVPYFFSDEFDLSYEFWGDTSGAAEVVHRGEVEEGRFSVWWLDGECRLVAAFVMNRPEEEREMAPQWIKSGKQLRKDWLGDAQAFLPGAP